MIRVYRQLRKHYNRKNSIYVLIQILYIKWMIGQCRHLCRFCEFWDMCEADMYEIYISEKRNK